jgi:hypothetical protein
MVDHLGIAERRQVGTFTILGSRADKANWARYHARDHELVVETDRAAFFERIDFNMGN